MNFSIDEIVDFIKTLIVPVFVSGIVSYWVSRITYKYESRHSDDVEIFANLYENLLFLRNNFLFQLSRCFMLIIIIMYHVICGTI